MWLIEPGDTGCVLDSRRVDYLIQHISGVVMLELAKKNRDALAEQIEQAKKESLELRDRLNQLRGAYELCIHLISEGEKNGDCCSKCTDD